MASTRKTTSTPNDNGGARPAEAGEQAERLSRSLSDTAQQIWLAGVGAFARAQAESTKLFEGLVKEGLSLEQSALKFADTQADVVRDALETGVETAAARAAGTWGQLETAVESGVRRALARLGVPDRDDIAELSRRVETLSAELRKQNGRGSASASPRKSAAGSAGKRTSASASTRSAASSKSAKAAGPSKATRKTTKRAAGKSATRTRG